MKKILLIASFADSILKFRGELIHSFQNENIEVHVVAPDINTVLEVQLKSKNINVHHINLERNGYNPISDIKYLISLYKLIRKIKPEYTLGYTIKPVIYGGISAWLANVSKRYSLITGLGYAFTGNVTGKRFFLQKLLHFMYKLSLSKSSLVLFQNNDDKNLFNKLNIIDSSKSCVVNGSGINISVFSPQEIPEVPSFLLIARLLGDKGIREYVDASRKLRKKHPSIKCNLVGWIDSNPDAISQLELDEWIANDYINYLGCLADVKPAIANSSIYVLPSYREGTPRTVLEAMAMQRAIITTDAPGCRETVTHELNGLLVPIKDSEALYLAMLRLVENPILVKDMSLASRIIVEDKYDVHKVNKQMLKYMEIIN